MKKKMMVSLLSGMFAIGALAACGGEGDEMNNGGGNEMENNPMEDNGMENNDGM
jgi:hypothetical protein